MLVRVALGVALLAIAVVAIGDERPRLGVPLQPAVIFGGHQPIHIVPKGDPRARSEAAAPAGADAVPLSKFAPFNGGRGMGARAETPIRAKGQPEIVAKRPPPPKSIIPNPIRPAFGSNYGHNKCTEQGGQCQTTITCGGIVTRNICPGPSYITCCTYTSTACAAIKGSCKDVSSCTGSVVKGLCPGGNNIACCTNAVGTDGALLPASAIPASKLQGGNCLANFNGPAFATRATQYQLAYTTNHVRFDASKRQFGASPPVAYADPSSFVTSVLDSLSWNCLFASGRDIPAMIPQMKVRGGFHDTPRIGDIATWNGHMGIVTDVCTGTNARLVSMTRTGAVDTGCVPLTTIKASGDGAFLGFWSPF